MKTALTLISVPTMLLLASVYFTDSKDCKKLCEITKTICLEGAKFNYLECKVESADLWDCKRQRIITKHNCRIDLKPCKKKC